MFRSEPHAGALVQPQPATRLLFLWHPQPFPTPDPLHPIPSHIPARALQQHRDPAIPITAIFTGQLNDRSGQRVFIVALCSHVSLRPSPLPQQPAGMPLGYSILLASMFDRATPPFGA